MPRQQKEKVEQGGFDMLWFAALLLWILSSPGYPLRPSLYKWLPHQLGHGETLTSQASLLKGSELKPHSRRT